MYNRFTVLYTWNYHDIVKQLYFNRRKQERRRGEGRKEVEQRVVPISENWFLFFLQGWKLKQWGVFSCFRKARFPR